MTLMITKSKLLKDLGFIYEKFQDLIYNKEANLTKDQLLFEMQAINSTFSDYLAGLGEMVDKIEDAKEN